MKTFEIWMEGYCVNEGHGIHSFLGTSKRNTFREAVISFINEHSKYKDLFNKENLTIWACRLFPTEEEDAKRFG